MSALGFALVEVDDEVEAADATRAEAGGTVDGWRAERLFDDFDLTVVGETVAIAELGRLSAWAFLRAAIIASRTEDFEAAPALLTVEVRRVAALEVEAFGLSECFSRAIFALGSREFMMSSALLGQTLARAQ
jgi:hypothetical protein